MGIILATLKDFVESFCESNKPLKSIENKLTDELYQDLKDNQNKLFTIIIQFDKIDCDIKDFLNDNHIVIKKEYMMLKTMFGQGLGKNIMNILDHGNVKNIYQDNVLK